MKSKIQKRKRKSEIESEIINLLSNNNEISINEIRKNIDSNWITVKKYLDTLVTIGILIPKYKKIVSGYELKKLNDTEKKIINILIEGGY